MTEQNSSLSRSWQRLPLDGQVGVLPYVLVIEGGGSLCTVLERTCPACGEVHPGRDWQAWHATRVLAAGVQPG
jgi:hypothetical protein